MQPRDNLLGFYLNMDWTYIGFFDKERNRLGCQMEFHLVWPENCTYFKSTTLKPHSGFLAQKSDGEKKKKKQK